MKKGMLSMLLMLALVLAMSTAVFAQAASGAQEAPAISSESVVVLDGSAVSEDAPESQPEDQSSSSEVPAPQEQQPESGGDGNTPLFVIAGISIIGFIAVVIICKKKGRNR